MSDIAASVSSQPITATVSGSSIAASVGSSAISVSVAGGIGPQGPSGDAGAGGGASLSNDTPLAPGTASAGTASTASRSDHRHAAPAIGDISGLQAAIDGKQAAGSYAAASHTHSATDISSGTLDAARLPTISYTALSNVPTTFSPETHTHALSSLTQSSATAGQVVAWNGSAWSPATPTAATTDASALTSGTLSDSRLSSNVVRTTTATGQSNQSASAVDVFERTTVATTRAPNTGTAFFSFFTPLVTVSVSSIAMATGTSAAASLTLARMGLYTWDETTLTLVARTASDTTLFTAQNTLYTRNWDSSGGFASSYTLNAGTRYAVGVILVGTTVGGLLAATCLEQINALSPRLQASKPSLSDLPTTVTSFSGSPGAIIWARLA